MYIVSCIGEVKIINAVLRKKTTLVLGFEERSPDLQRKQTDLGERFRNEFADVVFVVHPYGIDGEIPGEI